MHITNEHQILEVTYIPKQTQIINEPQILKEKQIFKEISNTIERQILK
jgi:hypothetical protein